MKDSLIAAEEKNSFAHNNFQSRDGNIKFSWENKNLKEHRFFKLKRLFDIIISCSGLVFLLPFMILVIIAICVSSKGPLFFTQSRVGQKGKIFKVVKFRTMIVGGEKEGSITTATDKRVTKIGRWIRRFKLDEYPQLWNVLIGNMSLVGPRPDVPGYADRLRGRARAILSLRPGITGPATLYFKNEEKLLDQSEDPKRYNDYVVYPAKVALNLDYLERWSFGRDIGYILVTVFPFLERFLRLVPEENIDTLAHNGIEACRER